MAKMASRNILHSTLSPFYIGDRVMTIRDGMVATDMCDFLQQIHFGGSDIRLVMGSPLGLGRISHLTMI